MSTHAELVALISGAFILVTNVGLVSITGLPVPVGVEFFIALPVVQSKSAGTQSVEVAGQVTSPVPHVIDMLPLPRRELPFTVFIFVPETRVSCLEVARPEYWLLVALSHVLVPLVLPNTTN